MKKTIRILIPIILAIAIVLCMAWYLFIYDRTFTRDVLLGFARYSESQGNHSTAAWFYSLAYSQASDNDAVAIELANQYKSSGNYTKAEFTLSNAIHDGGGIDLYIALCKIYVEQDKLLDAVNMLDNITNPEIKSQLAQLRPEAPTTAPTPGFYNQYISITLSAKSGTIYANANKQYPSVADDPCTEPIALQDGENTIYAVAVSDDGLVSPLSIFGYTVGGVIEKMVFSDAAVEAEVRKTLAVSEDQELYTNDLWKIKSFSIPAGAKSYADLKHMPFLEALTVENGVSDELKHLTHLQNLQQLRIVNTGVSQDHIAIIGALSHLKTLTLHSCGITSIASLVNTKDLTVLDLSSNAIRNIDALKNFVNLSELYLQQNALADVSALAGLTNLTKINISSNAITSLAPLSGLTAVTWLDAGTNSITDLGDIGKLNKLAYLSLKSNKLTGLSTISSCSELIELDLSSNQLTDISGVEKLTNLHTLNFSYNQVIKLPAFKKSCALVTISGNNNDISSLDPLSGLKSLNNVNMDYNKKISSVKPLSDCPVLIEVNVYGTKVTNVTALTNQSIIVNYDPIK